MTVEEADAIARSYLAERIVLVHVSPPVGEYRSCARSDEEHVYFSVTLDPRELRVGGARVIAVSQLDGHVDDLGMCGE